MQKMRVMGNPVDEKEASNQLVARRMPKPTRKTPASLSSQRATRLCALTLLDTAPAKAHKVKQYTTVMSAIVAAIAAKVTAPWWVVGLMKSGKKAI
jgi:nitric oxide reductase activation protein